MRSLLLFFTLLSSVAAFAPPKSYQSVVVPSPTTKLAALPSHKVLEETSQENEEHAVMTTTTASKSSTMTVAAGLSTGFLALTQLALAGEEIEMAELPPPYVPAIFAVVLLVGVGVLTGSLGNVMDEEAALGLQSGARARKEIERSKSSYFKRR